MNKFVEATAKDLRPRILQLAGACDYVLEAGLLKDLVPSASDAHTAFNQLLRTQSLQMMAYRESRESRQRPETEFAVKLLLCHLWAQDLTEVLAFLPKIQPYVLHRLMLKNGNRPTEISPSWITEEVDLLIKS